MEPRFGHDFSQMRVHSAASPMVQTKLAVSQPGDVYEQEADRVAEQVMRMPGSTLQRACASCAAGGAPCPRCAGEKKELVQRSTGNLKLETGNSNTSVPDNFLHSLGPGQPLDASTRAFFEPRFGHDFSQVRIHADSKAAESARSVNALAFTVGRDVVFGAGQYAPETSTGQRLLAHELTHTVQQRPQSAQRPTPSNQVQRQGKDADSLPVVRSTVLKAPPIFQQVALTCWAAAISSWLLVKGIVKQGFSDKFLIDHYKGTSCVDESGALVGEDATEDVFAEWRLAIDMGAEIQQDKLNAATVEQRLLRHGHFILATGSGTLHAIVVYGIEVHSADDPLAYSLLVMDPLLGVTERKHHMFFDYPVRVAVGLPKSGGPAPCRRGAGSRSP